MTNPCRAGLLLAILMGGPTGCTTIYQAATDERPLSVFVDDEVITAKIKKGFLDAVPKALSLSVFCHQGRVVLAGAVPDSQFGDQAVAVARAVEGVKQVETYFLPAQPSPLRDFELGAKIKAKIIGDSALRISQVDMVVIAGHAVLTGIVDRREKIDQIIRYARSVEGIVVVKSFLVLKTQ